MTIDQARNEIKRQIRFSDLLNELFPDSWDTNKSHGLCPFHDDTDPSLKVHDQYGLCFGNCSNGDGPKKYDIFDVVSKAYGVDHVEAVRELAGRCGLTVDQTPQRRNNPDQQPVRLQRTPSHKPASSKKGSTCGPDEIAVQYDYRDERGELLYQVIRYNPKSFRQRKPDREGGWTWSLGNLRRVLFRLPELLAADPDQPIVVCEGEKDALMAVSMGFVATTNPGGAGKWNGLVAKDPRFIEPLKGRDVWLVPDTDEPGRKHALDVAMNIFQHTKGVRIITLPKGFKDLSDYATANGADRAKDELIRIARGAPNWRPPGAPEIISARELLDKEIPEPTWTIEGLLPRGLILLIGKPKGGKSWLTQNLGLSVANGSPALNRFPSVRARTLNLCLEDSHARLRDRLKAMLNGDRAPDNHMLTTTWSPFDKGGIDQLHKELERNEDISLVSIDTWSRFRPKRSRSDDQYLADYADLQQLHALTQLFDVSILLVHHAKKESTEDFTDAALGSTALVGAVDALLYLKRQNRTSMDASLHITGRDLPDAEYGLRFDQTRGLWEYAGDPAELNMTEQRREVREIVAKHGKPISKSDIAKARGKSPSSTSDLVDAMVRDGVLDRAAGQSGKVVLPPEDDLYATPWNRGREEDEDRGFLDEL